MPTKFERPSLAAAGRFLSTETGGITSLGLFMFVGTLMLGGYAIDTASGMAARTQLQVTADSAAHAALVTRERGTEAEAVARALAIAAANLPAEVYGPVIRPEDVTFGTWDVDANAFVPQPGSRSAVRVTARRNDERGNAQGTFLLNLVGVDAYDIERTAILTTYVPTCFREGFVAEGVVDMQSNNTFGNGFCIHSNDHVAFNNNNYFEPGTIVSMPNPDDIVLPNSGFSKNEGLSEALREGSYNIRILNRIDAIITGLANGDAEFLPAFINSGTAIRLSDKRVDRSHFTEGRIHTYSCAGGKLTIEAGSVLRNVILVTDCEVDFGNGVVLEDVVIATTNTSATSFTATSGLRVGRDDGCAQGGGAQLVTKGGMRFPAKLSLFGGQLLAAGDIDFAAEAYGVEGASMVAGGRIDGTSNTAMAFCGSGMESSFQAQYFRLVL
jgi:hypothetical protein